VLAVLAVLQSIFHTRAKTGNEKGPVGRGGAGRPPRDRAGPEAGPHRAKKGVTIINIDDLIRGDVRAAVNGFRPNIISPVDPPINLYEQTGACQPNEAYEI